MFTTILDFEPYALMSAEDAVQAILKIIGQTIINKEFALLKKRY